VAKRLRAAICARVSTTEQARGTSLETQVAEGHAYARSRDLDVIGEYVDGGVSGKYANRPGLDRLMADCRAGLVDVVIVSKHDRFGRSFRHTVTLIGELEELGVEFVSIAERIDNSPSGRFQRNVLLSVAEFERERIVERATAGMEATARAGRWPVGHAPFGWKTVKGESGRTTVALNPPEVEAWERIVACMVDKRMSTLQAARELNAAGYRRRSGKLWTANSLWDLLRDTTCLSGTWTYRRPEGRNGRKALTGPPVEIAVPPLLTPERHEALKSVIKARSWSRRQTKHAWLLSGRLSSPHGRTMHGMHDARGNRRYRCPGRFAPDGGGGGDCGCHTVHADDVEARVWEVVVEALSQPEMLLALARDQAVAAAQASEVSEADLAALDRRIARLERAAGEQLAKALAAGADPKVAAVAASHLGAELVEARERREMLAAWTADAAQRRSRADVLAEIAGQVTEALTGEGNVEAKQRVLEAMSVRARVTRWATCDVCGGSGRLRGRSNWMCAACHGMRRTTEIEIDGAIPVPEAGQGAEAWPVRLLAG
jgi:DNA invertase Pin-like site-specific DNA recombinase